MRESLLPLSINHFYSIYVLTFRSGKDRPHYWGEWLYRVKYYSQAPPEGLLGQRYF